MYIKTKIVAIVIVMLTLISMASPRNLILEITDCPFGVCMGDEPLVLFENEAQFDVFVSDGYWISKFVPPVIPESLTSYIWENDGEFLYSGAYSSQTGICMVRLSVRLPFEQKDSFINLLTNDISSKLGKQIAKKNTFANHYLLWEKPKDIKDVDLILLGFTKKREEIHLDGRFLMRLEFRFKNYTECIMHQPSIETQFYGEKERLR